MQKRIVSVLSILAIAISLCACGDKTEFDGKETVDDEHFDVEFSFLDTTFTHCIELDAGDSVDVSIENQGGNIAIKIQKDDEEPIYTGNHLPTSNFKVGIDDAGIYTMTLTGDNAKGHVTFTRDKCIQPEDVIEKFFDAFENADYETMKQYCTEDCKKQFFHDGDVDGMVWARLIEIQEDDYLDAPQNMSVRVEMETVPESALYDSAKPVDTTYFYVYLVDDGNGSWLIDGFPTG